METAGCARRATMLWQRFGRGAVVGEAVALGFLEWVVCAILFLPPTPSGCGESLDHESHALAAPDTAGAGAG
jgi:hypothetical protein